MHIVALAWIYVVVLMAAAEAMSSNGSMLGAFFTLLLYGVLPLAVVLYLMGAPMRRQARLKAEQRLAASAAQPDSSSHAPSEAVSPVREEL